MKKDREDILIKRFPFWFHANNYGSNQNGFSFDCGDGWFDIIQTLFLDIEKVFETIPYCHRETFTIWQLKEKFGQLRIYVRSGTTPQKEIEEINKLIMDAEIKSSTICEKCGKETNGFEVKSHWIRTICEECIRKEQDERQ